MKAYQYFPSKDFGREYVATYFQIQFVVSFGQLIAHRGVTDAAQVIHSATAEKIRMGGEIIRCWVPDDLNKDLVISFANRIYDLSQSCTVNGVEWNEEILFTMRIDLQNRFDEPVDDWTEDRVVLHWTLRCVNPWDYDFEMKCPPSDARSLLTRFALMYGLDVREQEDFNAPLHRRQHDMDLRQRLGRSAFSERA